MNWTLDDVRSLSRAEYDVLVQQVNTPRETEGGEV